MTPDPQPFSANAGAAVGEDAANWPLFSSPPRCLFFQSFLPQADSVYERSFVKVLEVINLGFIRSTGGYWERRCPPAILLRRTSGQFSSTAVCLQPARVNFQTRAFPHINFSQLISAP